MKSTVFAFITIAVLALTGCALPPKEKVDVQTFPVRQQVEVKRTPGSIWPGTQSRNMYFTDLRARDVGDIIKVLIVENTSAKGEATTETSGSSESSHEVEDIFGALKYLETNNFYGLGKNFNPTLKGGKSSTASGAGSTERTGQISATIAVRVTQLMSNGNLYVEGRKETTINKERQYVELSGVVRAADVSTRNTITSDLISDLRVELSGHGVVSKKQKPGAWMTDIMDVVWPF